MVAGYADLYHSRLTASMNLGLLDPKHALGAAVQAYEDGVAQTASVEGFVRQILGWREFIRGVYRARMPAYAHSNALGAKLPMPAQMWTGDTHVACVRDGVAHLQAGAYTHHIQRLMVLGQFCLPLGLQPPEVHHWHMGMYLDAVGLGVDAERARLRERLDEM